MISLLSRFKKVRKGSFINRDRAILIICIGMAFVFWLLATLSKDYVYPINFPVKYVNLPEDKVILSDLPGKLKITVEASGRSLIGKMLDINKPTLVIDLEKHEKKPYIPTNNLKGFFENQLSPEFSVINIKPDTIFFDLDEKLTVKVPVKVNHDLEFKKQFNQSSELITNPDSITVTGPVSAVSGIESWSTDTIMLKDLNATQIVETELQDPQNSSVQLSADKVTVTIPVEEFSEGKAKVPVKVKNAPPDARIILYPKKIVISYQTSLSQYNKVKASHFEAIADFSKIDIKNDQKVPVELVRKPENVVNVTYSPQTVEFIIYK